MASADDRVTVGDLGKKVRVLIGFDISGANSVKMKVLKPDGRTKEIWDAVVDPDDNTKIRHDSVEGDFDVPGTYILYSHVKMDGFLIRGKPVSFTVYAEWEK